MYVLITGVLLFTTVHLFPAAMKPTRDTVAARLGDNPYKGLFSLLSLGAFVMIVSGWQITSPSVVYVPPLRPGPITSGLVLVALILFVASGARTNLKRLVRHPQLTGMGFWSAAHLLANGDSRSVVLFGGLGAWSVVAMLLSNRRNGAWQRPAAASFGTDAVVIGTGIVAFAAIAYFHRWLFGVGIGPGLPAF